MKQLSIIVPVYQVEQYIRTCVESIFAQGLSDDDFELILVNDGTRDQSFERIADIISVHQNIIVLEQKNMGLSAARNTGLTHATGQYILFLDSDDLLVEQSLPALMHAIGQQVPDLLVAGFKKMTDAEIEHLIPALPQEEATFETLTGEELFVKYLNARECYVWRTIYRRAFLEEHHLRFIPGIYFEDVPFTTECYLKASTCLRTSHLFYIYRQREASICSTIDARKIYDLNTVVARLWVMRQQFQLPEPSDQKMTDVIFITFSITQWYTCQYDHLFEMRKQLTDDLLKKVPQLRFPHTFKQKMVTLFFRLMPCQYLWFKRTFSK